MNGWVPDNSFIKKAMQRGRGSTNTSLIKEITCSKEVIFRMEGNISIVIIKFKRFIRVISIVIITFKLIRWKRILKRFFVDGVPKSQ